jgi:hypothetical protein
VSGRCFEFITRCSGAYSCPYSSECVEGLFRELRLYSVIGGCADPSSSPSSPNPFSTYGTRWCMLVRPVDGG